MSAIVYDFYRHLCLIANLLYFDSEEEFFLFNFCFYSGGYVAFCRSLVDYKADNTSSGFSSIICDILNIV